MASTEQEHAEILAQINRELQEFGRVLPGTQANLDAVSAGLPGFGKATALAAEGAKDLGKAFTAGMSAMYNGEKGMKAYNKSITHGADAVGNLTAAAASLGIALGVLSGPVGLLVLGIGAAVKGIAEYTKATNEMSDQLFDTFQKLSRVGGAGADSLQGVYNDMQKLGLGVQDLDKFVALVAGSSKELAMMSGSVIKGRKEYAEVSKSMDQFKVSLMNSGMTQDEINEGSMGYLRLQSKIGMTQNKSANELAASTAKYLEQQDALTQLTGLTRKDQEAAREEIRAQEAFGAKLMALRNAGQEDAAKELEDTYLLLASKSKSAAQGFADISTGNLRTEAAQKSMRATQGESLRTAQALASGQLKAAEGADSIAQAHARTLDTFGETQGQLGNYNKTFSDFGGDMALKASQASGGFAKNAEQLRKEREKQGTTGQKALSAEQQRQVDLAITQQKSMQNMQDFVRLGVEPATQATSWFAETIESLTSLLPGAGKAKAKLDAERQGKKEAQKRDEDVKKAELEATAAKVKMDTATNDEAKKAAELELKAAEEKVKLAKEVKARGGLSKAATEAPSTPDTGGVDAMGNATGAATPEPTPPAPPAPPAPSAPPPPAPARMGRFNRMPGAATTPGVSAAPPAPTATAPSGGSAPVASAAPAAAAAPSGGSAPAAAAAKLPGKVGPAGSGGGGKESLGATPPPDPQKPGGAAAGETKTAGGGGIDESALKNMVKAHEGVVQYPYKDILGLWTIGVGHLIGNGKTLPPEFADWANNGPAYGPGSKNNNKTPAWSMEKVDQVLDQDLQMSKQGASRNTKNFDTMSSPGKTAFVDLAFNMGPNWIKQKGFVSLDAALERKDNEGIKNSLINSKWYTQVGDRGKQVVNLAGAAFAEKGGEFNGPNSGYPATLHGKEAVIPLDNNSGNFVKMFEEIASSNRDMVAMMEEIVRVNKATNGISEKMLRVAQS